MAFQSGFDFLNANTITFAQWLSSHNQILNEFRNTVVTAANGSYANTDGDARLNGTFVANTLFVIDGPDAPGGLSGGQSNTLTDSIDPADLYIVSNTIFTSDANLVTIEANLQVDTDSLFVGNVQAQSTIQFVNDDSYLEFKGANQDFVWAQTSTVATIRTDEDGSLEINADVGANSADASKIELKVDDLPVAQFNEGGDVAFYAANGTSQLLVWDADNLTLGVNTGAPIDNVALHVVGNTQTTDLTVEVDATIENNLFVQNTADITVDLIVGNDALIGNDATVNNDLFVEQNATVKADLQVDGNANIGIDLDVGGNTDIGDNLDVTANTTTGNLAVTQFVFSNLNPDTTLTHTLGNTSFEWLYLYAQDADFSGDVNIDGDTAIGGNTSIGDSLTVANDALISNDLTVVGELDVSGDSSLTNVLMTTSSLVTVDTDTQFNGSVNTIDNDLIVGNALTSDTILANVVTIKDELKGVTVLNVTSNAAFVNATTFANNVTLNGANTVVNGTLTISTANLEYLLVPSNYNDLTPNETTGRLLGNTTHQWDGNFRTIDVSANASIADTLTVDKLIVTDSATIPAVDFSGVVEFEDLVVTGTANIAALEVSSLVTNTAAIIGTSGVVDSTDPTKIDEFTASDSKGFKYIIHGENDDTTSAFALEINCSHNGTTVFFTRFGEVSNNFDCSLEPKIVGANVQLVATCSSASVSNTHAFNIVRIETR